MKAVTVLGYVDCRENCINLRVRMLLYYPLNNVIIITRTYRTIPMYSVEKLLLYVMFCSTETVNHWMCVLSLLDSKG